MTQVVIENNGDLYQINRKFKEKGKKYESEVEIFKNKACISASGKKTNQHFIEQNFGRLTDLTDTHVAKRRTPKLY